jgi:hypothetical protein
VGLFQRLHNILPCETSFQPSRCQYAGVGDKSTYNNFTRFSLESLVRTRILATGSNELLKQQPLTELSKPNQSKHSQKSMALQNGKLMKSFAVSHLPSDASCRACKRALSLCDRILICLSLFSEIGDNAYGKYMRISTKPNTREPNERAKSSERSQTKTCNGRKQPIKVLILEAQGSSNKSNRLHNRRKLEEPHSYHKV